MTAGETAPRTGPDAGAPALRGLLPAQDLGHALATGAVAGDTAFAGDQVQPASLDLRLGPVAYRVRASVLPGPGATVAEKIDAVRMHEIDLSRGAVLERGCVYIVPLMERLALPADMAGIANPKSSTGRLDVFARVISDRNPEFDQIAAGYHGPLYAEVSPRTFSVLVRPGSRLVQLRLRRGAPLYCRPQPVADGTGPATVEFGPDAESQRIGVPITVALRAEADRPIGFRARRHAGLIDVDRAGHYDPADFFEPVAGSRHGTLILDPGEFYILASKESVQVPVAQAAEMLAYDTLLGEFRVHYAGFFDPGFGLEETGGTGARAVLEVRSHEVPFMIEDGQIVGRLFYERLTAVPDRLYGTMIGSSYQRQGLALSKHFRKGLPW
ncbi:MAG: 2'-deoxycytidine 5'-triphosphate deaminase [Alphaproteobacteria bacterium]|jgi:dCTP deaminase|nr:2'-deoxycytidine 5'-triphosphate deaminase [Alphaproteobacteria bacterium]